MTTTILITGGTGLTGQALGQALLEKGYQVIVLTRQKEKKSTVAGLSYAYWDISKQVIDEAAFGHADYIVHLAGAGVAEKRWTKKRKEEIARSRIDSSRLIVDGLRKLPHRVKAVVSASAIGWYGPDPVVPNPQPFTEDDPPDNSFLGETCRQWENSIDPVTELGIRLVKLRTGIVISRKGGALKEFLKPLKAGVAAVLGNGKQIVSWIHLTDLVNIYIAAMENTAISGVYNAVAPAPVSNRELVLTLARCRGRFFIRFPVPSFLLKLFLGEMSIEILKSATVSAGKIKETGFEFSYPLVGQALMAETR